MFLRGKIATSVIATLLLPTAVSAQVHVLPISR